MNDYLQSTIAMLAVINPFVCGAMMLKISQNEDRKAAITTGAKAMVAVLIILLIAAVAGNGILKVFGISMDAFKVVGGIVLAVIGFNMLLGPRQKTGDDGTNKGAMPLIMFAASPGTISMVITLSVANHKGDLPVSVMIGTTLAVLLTIIIMTLMLFFSNKNKAGGQSLASSFIGLIIVAMGLQFMLTGIKDFFLN